AKAVSGTCEAFAIDSGGNVSQLSRHPVDVLNGTPASLGFPFGENFENSYLGKRLTVDTASALAYLEICRMSVSLAVANTAAGVAAQGGRALRCGQREVPPQEAGRRGQSGAIHAPSCAGMDGDARGNIERRRVRRLITNRGIFLSTPRWDPGGGRPGRRKLRP